MAGAGGFEPPVTGPKPAALPLGYAPPDRGSLYFPVEEERGQQEDGEADEDD